jgi:hypothetical protein
MALSIVNSINQIPWQWGMVFIAVDSLITKIVVRLLQIFDRDRHATVDLRVYTELAGMNLSVFCIMIFYRKKMTLYVPMILAYKICRVYKLILFQQH